MWVRSTVRKLHTDGKYYLTDVYKSYQLTDDTRPLKAKIIHQLFRQFNFMVYMMLIHSAVQPELKNPLGWPIYSEDPDQTPDIERVYSEDYIT